MLFLDGSILHTESIANLRASRAAKDLGGFFITVEYSRGYISILIQIRIALFTVEGMHPRTSSARTLEGSPGLFPPDNSILAENLQKVDLHGVICMRGKFSCKSTRSQPAIVPQREPPTGTTLVRHCEGTRLHGA